MTQRFTTKVVLITGGGPGIGRALGGSDAMMTCDPRNGELSSAMDSRDIRIFLALCEELHFGRTAERLGLSLGRVSQVVRDLERHIGGSLFDRSSRAVGLTPLGEYLRDELRPGFERVERAIASARSLAAAGITGELVLGVTSGCAAGPVLARIIRAFEDRHPACRVTERNLGSAGGLCSVDIAATWLPLDDPGLMIGPELTAQAQILGMPAGHPLAGGDHAVIEDLAECTILGRIPWWPQATCEALWPRFTPAGRPIRRDQRECDSADQVLSLIARGEIVQPSPAFTATFYRHPAVAWRPIHGMPVMRSALVWRGSAISPMIFAFADVAREILAPRPGRP